MQHSKPSFKVFGLAVFLLVSFILLNVNESTFAADDYTTIQEAIKRTSDSDSNSGNYCIQACLGGVYGASTYNEFKNQIEKITTCNIRNLCVTGTNEKANTLLNLLKEYIANPLEPNLEKILAFLGVSSSHDTTGCISDKNDPKLKSWLAIIDDHDIVKTHKASTCPDDNPITLECLAKIITSIRTDGSTLKRAGSPLAELYTNYANELEAFRKCPTQNNFDNLNKYYTDYFVPEYQKINNSIISTTNAEEGSCALDLRFNLNILDWLTGGLVYLFYMIFRGLLSLILQAFQWVLYPAHFGGYLNFLNTTLVSDLWTVIRNIANIGIIIGMIAVAIATILRIEKYSWKKVLPRLLLVALLVNFSLVIAGIFVDVSNYISVLAVTQFGNTSLSNIIIQQTICPTIQGFYDLGGSWQLTRAGIIGLALSTIFLFQFIGLFFYVATRVVTILICLITSPLAFIVLAFPGLEKGWDFWRQRFQQAIVSLPVLCIVLYLSLSFINTIVNSLGQQHTSNLTITIMYAAFVIAFAQLVRYVAKFLGVEQVEKGFQLAKKAVAGVGLAAGGLAAGRAIQGVMESKAYQKVGEGLAHVPLLQGVGQKMMVQGEINKKKRMEEYEKEMGQLSKGTLQKFTEQAPPNPLVDKIAYEKWQAATNVRADKGHGIAEENVDWIIRHSDDPGFNLKAISSTRPDLVKMNPDKTARQKLVKVNDDIDSAIASITSHKTEDIMKYMDGSAVLEHFENKGQLNEFSQKLITAFPQPSQIAAFWKSVDAKDKVPVVQGGKDYYAKFVKAIGLNTNALNTFKDALKYSRPLREDFRNI